MTAEATRLIVAFEPLDVIVAADARPLDDGGWGFSGELNPHAFAGSLRTLIARQGGFPFRPGGLPDRGSLSAEHEELASQLDLYNEGEAALQCFAPLLLRPGGSPLLLPMPRDHLRPGHKRPDLERHCRLRPAAAGNAAFADGGLGEAMPLQRASPDDQPADDRWSLEELCRQLARDAESPPDAPLTTDIDTNIDVDETFPAHELFREERRFAHRRSPSETVEDAALFSRASTRMVECRLKSPTAPASYAAVVQSSDSGLLDRVCRLDQQLARLGGDGRLVRLRVLDGMKEWEIADRLRELVLATVGRLRGLLLYLATPTVFDNGWRPTVDPPGCQLVAAAVGKPRTIAGWDLAKRGPRPIFRAAPAGSVYLYRLSDDACTARLGEWIRTHHARQSVSDEYPRLGYGFALTGVWDARNYKGAAANEPS